ncbi:MAG: hypothetical protein Q7S31_00235 [bacterium]|nr:hypothetical protein [bacterium]
MDPAADKSQTGTPVVIPPVIGEVPPPPPPSVSPFPSQPVIPPVGPTPVPPTPVTTPPPLEAPPVSPASGKKWSTGALVGVISAVFLVIASIVTGITLYQRRSVPVAPTAPASQPEAAPSGTILDRDGLVVTVIDTGPGNFESNHGFKPLGQNDTRPVLDSTLTQTYKIKNNRTETLTFKLIGFPYKMYRIGGVGTDQCTDLYTPEQINNFVAANGSNEDAYLQFATGFYAVAPTLHIYDNPAVSLDPSGGQARPASPVAAGGLSCSYLHSISETRYADSQTLVTKDQTPPYLLSNQEVTVAPGEEKEATFSLTNSVCGFYQFDHGLLINGSNVFWTGSEIKFFPCATTPSPSPSPLASVCQEVRVFKGGVEIATSDIKLNDTIVFRGFASATGTAPKLRFTLTKGGVAQTPVEKNTTLVGGLYQADYQITADEATSYSVTSVVIAP